MKKTRLISLLLAVLMLLTGCGKVGQVEEAIAAIGTVTLESEDVILVAEALVGELSERSREKLSNLEDLTDAREEYNRLTAAVEKANSAIMSIGVVSLSSENAIAQAREAYDALAADNLTDYAAGYYPILTAAENQYVYLLAQALYDEAFACYEAGKFSDAMGLLDALREQYPDSEFAASSGELDVKCLMGTAEDLFRRERYDEVLSLVDNILKNYPEEAKQTSARKLGAQCYVAQATDLYNRGNLQDAISMLGDGEAKFSMEMDSEGGTELQARIDAELEAIRPANGEVLTNQGYVVGGYCRFTVDADSTHDALVKLERVDDPSKYVMFYVRAGESASVNIQPGTYYAKYCTGFRWYGEEIRFGDFSSYIQADDTMQFSVSYDDDYVYYTTIRITLYSTAGGNLDTKPIPEGSF